MTKRKWGDRKDGIWLKDIPAMNRMMPVLMPNRADNEAHISVDIDLAPINAYLAKLNDGRTEDKYTFFHIVSAAIGKAFILRPKMNRFIVGTKMYQRRDVSIAFTVKKRFDDHAEEALAFFTYDPKETLDSYHEKIMKVIHVTKSYQEKDTTTGSRGGSQGCTASRVMRVCSSSVGSRLPAAISRAWARIRTSALRSSSAGIFPGCREVRPVSTGEQ